MWLGHRPATCDSGPEGRQILCRGRQAPEPNHSAARGPEGRHINPKQFVDLAKDPNPGGPLARSTTPELRADKAQVRLGVSLDMAIKHAISRKSYWRLSPTPAMQYAMPNKWLEQLGLLWLKQLWCYLATQKRRKLAEPPDADQHVRWCGEGRQQWRP